MTAWIKIAILAGALLLGLFLGWHFKGVTDTAKQNKAQVKAQQQYDQQRNTEIAAMLASTAKTVKIANDANDATAADLAVTKNLLEDQTHALSLITARVNSIPVGTCTFTAASDGVWNGAYRAVFPAAAAPAAAKNH